jgi:hypothetical protein
MKTEWNVSNLGLNLILIYHNITYLLKTDKNNVVNEFARGIEAEEI